MNYKRETEYKIAYSFLNKMSVNILREIYAHDISPEEFFTSGTKDLINKLGIRPDHDFDKINREEALCLAQNELRNCEKHNITPLFIIDDNYPSRLAETEDAPIILYKLGETDLESENIMAVVGTRKPTPYGLDFCQKLVEDFSEYFPDGIVVSGLAYGIDAAAHQKALEKNTTTVAVMAHGLNMIYPAAHRYLAKMILKSGGAIVSEYPFGVKPFRANFLARNRIVAALSDITVVAESKIKGGAMSTANFSFLYNRDVAALPGRTSDELSAGCNLLIRKNKAHLIENISDLIEITGWNPLNIPINSHQRNLFPEPEGEAKLIYDILKLYSEPVSFDTLVSRSGFPAPSLLSIIGELEFDGLVIRYPGNRYSVS